MSKNHLRIVEDAGGADPCDSQRLPLPPRRPAREVCADIWWRAVTIGAVVSGFLYVAVVTAIPVSVAMTTQEPLDVLTAGLALALCLFVGIAIARRLSRSSEVPAAPEATEVHHHYHHYPDSER